MLSIRLLVWFISAVAALGHTVHLGRTCPDVRPFPNLSIDKTLGHWYVAYKLDTDNTCLIWNITKDVNDPDVFYVTEYRQLSFLNFLGVDHRQAVTATLEMQNPEIPGKLRASWPTSISGKSDFIIFDTDYDQYLAIFECNRAGIVHRRSVTILSRKPTIDDMLFRKVKRILETAEVSHRSLDAIKHDLCSAKREPDWHIQGDFFGLVPNRPPSKVSSGIVEYDLSQIEILGDGVNGASDVSGDFRGSLKKQKTDERLLL